MPAKKKAAKKKPQAKKAAGKKRPVKKTARKRSSPKAGARKKPAKKSAAKPKARRATATASSREDRERSVAPGRLTTPRGTGSDAAGQSGALQGLSRRRGADSESVEELLEEGNAFEADIVAGVEDAGADEKPVRTHEVPEDDVPEEYLDRDQ